MSGNKPPKRRKHRYSENEKASVLAVLETNNGNTGKTARETGVLRQTIGAWKAGIGINEDVQNILHVKKEELRDLHKLIAVKALGLMQNKLSDCSAAQLSTIAAISTEKMLLLEGEPTSINKELLSNDDREQMKRELREKINQVPEVSQANN